jgi:UDP-N-acetylmuramoyl-tripeptide--D-alanyl-D-alanine ligase
MSDYQGKIITFGISEPSDYFGRDITYGKDGMNFILVNNGKDYKAFVPGYGEHNVMNALATLAALDTLGMKLSESINYLAKFKHIRSHVEFKDGINNSTIIDDTWSSNPTSMNEALKVLNGKGKDKIKIAVIGKINYLGEFKDIYYEKIAKMVIKHKINRLITLDNDAKKIGEYALEYGFEAKDIYHITDNVELIHTLKSMLNEKTIILFKFSMLDKSHQRVLRKVILKETK